MIGAQARHLDDGREQDFGRCDVVLPHPWQYAGGGGTRRRIIGAVGPERANYVRKSKTFSDAAWLKTNGGFGLAPVIVSEAVTDPDGGSTATRVTFDLQGANGLGDHSVLAQYEADLVETGRMYCAGHWVKIPVGQTLVARNVAGNAYVDLVGTGEWQRLPRAEVAGSTGYAMEIGLRGSVGSATTATPVTVDLWHQTLEEGGTLTPVIPNSTIANVTTTDWPRENRASVSEGTTANLDALAHFTDATRSIDGFDNAIAIPAGSELPGTAYAYKQCAYPDGTLVTVSLFVQMDDGGAPVPSSAGGAGYDFMLVADGFGASAGDSIVQHVQGPLYRVTTSRVSDLAGGGNAFYGLVKYAAQSERRGRVTGWHVRASNGVIDAYIKSGSGGRTVNTPPFGEVVTVPSGPRIDYDANGIGRGVLVSGAAINNVQASGDLASWTHYTNGAGAGAWQEMWDPVHGPFLRVTKTAGAVGDRVGVLSPVSAAGGSGLCAGIKVRWNGLGATGYAPYAEVHNGTEWITANTYYLSPVLGEWIDAAEGTSGGTMGNSGTFYAWNQGAVGTSMDIVFPRCNTGLSLHEYVESPADASGTKDADEITTTDMAALGLDGAAGTVVIRFTPPATSDTRTLLDGSEAGNQLYLTSAGLLACNGATTANAVTAGVVNVAALRFGPAGTNIRLNGGAFASVATLWPARTQLSLGHNRTGGEHLNGVIGSVTRWPRWLSDAETMEAMQ